MEICTHHNLPLPIDDEKFPVGTGSNPVSILYLISLALFYYKSCFFFFFLLLIWNQFGFTVFVFLVIQQLAKTVAFKYV